jgi:hypothetical protein
MRNHARISFAGSLVLAGLLGACDGGQPPGTIQLRWRIGYGVDCSDARADINKIRVRVLQPQTNKELLAPATFECVAGTGTLQGVPAGTYNLAIEGGKGADFTNPAFTGTAGGVVVKAGASVDIGTVVLAKVPETIDPGGLQIDWNFSGGNRCATVGVVNVRFQVWRDLVFLQHDKSYPCESPAFTLEVPPGLYGIIAEGIDANGKVVQRGTKPDAVVQQSGSTQVLITLAP